MEDDLKELINGDQGETKEKENEDDILKNIENMPNDDFIKNIESREKNVNNDSEKKEEDDVIYDEKKLIKYKNYFPKIKPAFHEELFEKSDLKYNLEESNIFFCGLKNENTGLNCEKGNEICPSCMKKNQKLYGLKPHYLINSAGRVCTYRKNKLFCLCKFSRIEDRFGFEYSIVYVCGQKQQCEPCKNLTKLMNRYFSQNLMNNLKRRDKIII